MPLGCRGILSTQIDIIGMKDLQYEDNIVLYNDSSKLTNEGAERAERAERDKDTCMCSIISITR